MFAHVDRVIHVLNAPVRILLTTIEDLVKLVSLPPLADYGIASGEKDLLPRRRGREAFF